MVERSLSMREVPGSIPGASILFSNIYVYCIYIYIIHVWVFVNSMSFPCHVTPKSVPKILLWKKSLQRPGIEPGPPAWQASILPLNQRCSDPVRHSIVLRSRGGKKKIPKGYTQSVGFEPTLPEGIWFLVRRLNHSATTATWKQWVCRQIQ